MAGKALVGPPPRDRDGDVALVAGGTLALVLTLLAPWYRTDVPGSEVHARGLAGPGWGWTALSVLCALTLTTLVLARRRGVDGARRFTARFPVADAVLGGACLAALAARLLAHGTFHSYGLRLGLLAATAVAAGGGSTAWWQGRGAARSPVRPGSPPRRGDGPDRTSGSHHGHTRAGGVPHDGSPGTSPPPPGPTADLPGDGLPGQGSMQSEDPPPGPAGVVRS